MKTILAWATILAWGCAGPGLIVYKYATDLEARLPMLKLGGVTLVLGLFVCLMWAINYLVDQKAKRKGVGHAD
jgi:hypothetical protein